jgi:hypothetical protein
MKVFGDSPWLTGASGNSAPAVFDIVRNDDPKNILLEDGESFRVLENAEYILGDGTSSRGTIIRIEKENN